MLRQLLLNHFYLKETEELNGVGLFVFEISRSEFYYHIFKFIANFKNLYRSIGKENFFCVLGETSYKLSVNIYTKFLYFIQIRIHNYLMQPFWIINGMVKHVNYQLIYVTKFIYSRNSRNKFYFEMEDTIFFYKTQILHKTYKL